MTAGRDWERLAGFVRERRIELGMTQEDVRGAGGPSTATMRLIEGALQENYQPATLRDLERVLRWERGSARIVLSGGDPVLLDAAPGIRPAPPPPAPLPLGLEETARAFGADPGDPANRFIRAVRQDVERAEATYGEAVTGIQVFHGGAAAEIEAMIWDDPRVVREGKIVAIALLRAHRAQQEAARSGDSRTTAGLAPRHTLASR
jgi:hypothetical protein